MAVHDGLQQPALPDCFLTAFRFQLLFGLVHGLGALSSRACLRSRRCRGRPEKFSLLAWCSCHCCGRTACSRLAARHRVQLELGAHRGVPLWRRARPAMCDVVLLRQEARADHRPRTAPGGPEAGCTHSTTAASSASSCPVRTPAVGPPDDDLMMSLGCVAVLLC